MNKNHSKFQVLIVNTTIWEGLSRLPALLYRAGCEVSLIAPASSYVGRSGFVGTHLHAPEGADATLDFLQQHLANRARAYDWVVIGDDPLLYALGKRHDQPWAAALFPTCAAPDSVDFVLSKIVFIQQCRQAGVAVPDFQVCEDRVSLKHAGRRLGFPMVLKEAQGSAGSTVTVVANLMQLHSLKPAFPVLAQAFVPGKIGSASAVFNQGKLVCWFSYFRERTWGALGPSTAVRFQHLPPLDKMLSQLGALSGFHGLCGIDFIQHVQTGELVLLEQNFRPTLTMSLGRRVGVDVVLALYSLLSGKVLHPPLIQNPGDQSLVPLFPSDIFRALEYRDWRSLLRWVLTPRWWLEMSWRDPKLMVFNLCQIAQRVLGLKR